MAVRFLDVLCENVRKHYPCYRDTGPTSPRKEIKEVKARHAHGKNPEDKFQFRYALSTDPLLLLYICKYIFILCLKHLVVEY